MGATTIPILPSADFDATAGFYALFGFDEAGRWPNEYLIIRHSGLDIELHFWPNPHVDRWTNDVSCYIRFGSPSDALACHAAWADVDVPAPATLSAPQVTDYGAAEFALIDVHGNLLRLGGFAND